MQAAAALLEHYSLVLLPLRTLSDAAMPTAAAAVAELLLQLIRCCSVPSHSLRKAGQIHFGLRVWTAAAAGEAAAVPLLPAGACC